MVQLSPDTRVEGWDACSGYHYSDSTIMGFSHTHLSGTGVADYGDVLIMPSTGQMRASPRPCRFHHEQETATPGYYSVLLEDYNIKAELTATRRVGVHRYTFPKTAGANILVDLHHGLGPDRVIASSVEIGSNWEITGMRRSEGWAKDQYIYFAARFSKPFEAFGTIVNDTVRPRSRTSSGRSVKAYIRFSTSEEEEVIVRVALSFVSVEKARANLIEEVPDWDFDLVRLHAAEAWNKELGKIEVEGGSDEQRTTFYTALYHTMIAPNLFSDVDGSYRGMDGKTHIAAGYEMHTVFSLWDTFRAEHPLLTIIDRQRTTDFVASLLAKYEESGVLPVWELAANETWCMIGYHSVPVIVDAYVKGITGIDAEKAFSAMSHSASLDHYGLKACRVHGYIPGETEAESVSKTLEYAYDDWCIAQMAKALGKPAEATAFAERAEYFRNMFDPATGFMRAKVNGGWIEPFDPTSVTFHYTEANPWQFSFFVPQNVDGLITLMGGKEKFIAKLDSLFKGGSNLAGRMQADITGMVGQYAQGNEPSHHVAYLYNYAGAPAKTQETVRRIMDSLYTANADGLCGNDDCGQLSAWYVMSALGFYQVCPGQPMYCIGSPLFEKVIIHLEDGKQFMILAKDNSQRNKYVQSAQLNGQPYSKSFLTHEVLMNGGAFELSMDSRPNTPWATRDEDVPHSLPSPEIVTVPCIQSHRKSFADSTSITISCNSPDTDVYYTLDGTAPDERAEKYSSAIVLTKTTTINAVARNRSGTNSRIASGEFIKSVPVGTIRLNARYGSQYTGGGDSALIDGLRGTPDFRLGAWQGYEQNDLDAVVELSSPKTVSRVALSCLQDNNSWIFFPTEIEFSFSDDGKTFRDVQAVRNDIPPGEIAVSVKEFVKSFENVRARYVRIHAKNMGVCPLGHKGAGGKAWLFADEILIDAK
jgi:predicted alpha-1,2-mannosidase